MVAEEEITKILEVLAEIRRELGIKKPDPQLEKMLERIDASYIERSILGQMGRANKSLVKTMLEGLPGPIVHPKTIITGSDNGAGNASNTNSNNANTSAALNPDDKKKQEGKDKNG